MKKKSLYYRLIRQIDCWFDFLGGMFLAPFMVKKTVVGGRPWNKKQLVIYINYDKNNKIHDYVLNQLDALNALGADIVFVTACNKFSREDEEKVLLRTNSLIYKLNHGLDFTGYQAGLLKTPGAFEYEQIVLMNDSCYGPFCDLGEVFKKMEPKDFDMWGITDSYEHFYHIQSYFLVFNSRMIKSRFFRNFWKFWPCYGNKWRIITHGEIGLRRRAVKNRFRLGVLCEYDKVLPHALQKMSEALNGQTAEKMSWDNIYSLLKADTERWLRTYLSSSVNQSHCMWNILIKDFGCPFLKIELLRDNPCKVINVQYYREFLEPKHVEMITAHLKEAR